MYSFHLLMFLIRPTGCGGLCSGFLTDLPSGLISDYPLLTAGNIQLTSLQKVYQKKVRGRELGVKGLTKGPEAPLFFLFKQFPSQIFTSY